MCGSFGIFADTGRPLGAAADAILTGAKASRHSLSHSSLIFHDDDRLFVDDDLASVACAPCTVA
jgi:hypothetical protein